MSNDILVSCLEHLSDELIQEAMVSKGKAKFRFSRRVLGIAACVSVVLTLSIAALIINLHSQQVIDLEQVIPMTLDEIHESIYADYIPNLEANGYTMDSAGLYNQVTFKASFYSDSSEVHILIEPYSPALHDQRIIDTDTIDQALEIDNPIFLADQFGPKCSAYITEQITATNLIVTRFSVLKNGYVAQYVIKAYSQEAVTQAIESICLCYK